VARHVAVDFQLLVYPVTDSALNYPTYAEFGERFGLTAEAMARFWQLYGADGSPDGSPLRADLEGLPPALVLTASHDVLRDEGEAYAAALPVAELRRIEGTVHGFWRWQTTEIARATVREAAASVRQALAS
jgi:acetyl esterase